MTTILATRENALNGAMTAAAWGAMPLGALVAGPLVMGLGLRGTLLAVGACYLIATLSMLFAPVLREMAAGRAINPP